MSPQLNRPTYSSHFLGDLFAMKSLGDKGGQYVKIICGGEFLGFK